MFCTFDFRCYCIAGKGITHRCCQKSEEEIVSNARKYLDTFRDLPYVFNLGHGLLPSTDPDKVEKLIKFYRNY